MPENGHLNGSQKWNFPVFLILHSEEGGGGSQDMSKIFRAILW